MAHARIPDPADPDEVGAAEFDTRRRGFDPVQVRAYLKVVARELARLRARETELMSELASARLMPVEPVVVEVEVPVEVPVEVLVPAPAEPVEFDEALAVQLLGEETTRVLATARNAAADIVARAEEQSAEILEQAAAQEAESAERARRMADEELAAARAEGHALVAEARLVRERLLDELAQRRHALRDQLEQMRAGRDRLARSYDEIRRALDEVSATLDEALPEAQRAARRAAARHDASPIPDASSIEREIEEAALAGAPIVAREEIEAADLAPVPEEDDTPAWVNAGVPRVTEDARRADADDEPVELDVVAALDHETVAVGDAGSRGGAVAVVPAEQPHEILLAEITRSRRDAGLPRVGVPIVDPPDEVETVRVLPAERADTPPEDACTDAATAVEEPTDLGATEAEVSEVEITEVEVSEVEVSDVEVTELESTELESTELESTELESTEPAGAEDPTGAGEAVPEEMPSTSIDDLGSTATASTDIDDEPAAGGAARSAEDEVDAEELAAEDLAAEADPAKVDDLFDRIRRTRKAKVVRAHEVLRESLFDPIPEDSPAAAAARPTDRPVGASEPALDLVIEPEVVISDDRLGAAHAGDAAHFAERDRVLQPLQAQVVRKLKRLLADEQNDVLDLVRRSRGKVRHDDVLPDEPDHAGRYVAAIGGELLSAVSSGASFFPGAASTGAGADVASLDQCVADEVVRPLRLLLERAVDLSEDGEDEMLEHVRSAYREVRNQRADDAARTVALAAFNAGVEAAHAGGLVRWAVDPVHGCSPDCDDNALEGAIEAGTPFPTGATRPPGHRGCRCLLVPADR